MTEIEGAFTAFSHRAAKTERQVRYVEEPEDTKAREPLQFDPDELQKLPNEERRWSWVEIDLNAIRRNCSAIKQRIGRNRHLMAVVSADAFGHGAERVAKTALNSGADYLGVASINEAIKLREALVNAPILVLSQPPEAAIPLFLAYKVMPTIYTSDFAIKYAETADAYGIKAPYHLAVNTGMNRLGVHHDQVVEFLSQVGFHRALELKGTFTHFATADQRDIIDLQKQAMRFMSALSAMQAAGFDPGLVHAANSVATIRYPDVHFDMVRIGTALYGYHSTPETRGMILLEPAMSVHARIIDTRLVPVGEGVSFGLNYRSRGSAKTVTAPIGYADGLPRCLSGRINALYRGQVLNQVGDICMDQCVFEADLRTRARFERLDPQIGEQLTIVGTQGDMRITMEELANLAGVTPNELCIGFAQRMPRVYV